MRALFSKPKFYFLAIAPLLLATAIIQVDCPTCHGQGSVVGSNHMDSVRIISSESRIVDSIQDACTGYIITKAYPIINAYNFHTEAAEGWLTVQLVNLETNEVLTSSHLPVHVEGEAHVMLNSLVVFAFYSADIPPKNLDIRVEALTGTVPDNTCGGSGKVGLNVYFLARSFKTRLVSETVQSTPFGPDLRYGEPGSEEWLRWNELELY